MARYLDDTWERIGKPAPFVVVEGGAGAGKLARDVLANVETCGDALTYVAVDRSAAQRELAAERLAHDERAVVAADLPAVAPTDAHVDARTLTAPGAVSVVLANELLDNMAPRVLVRTDEAGGSTGFGELWVAGSAVDGSSCDEPAPPDIVLVPAPADVSSLARQLVGDVALGTAVPLQLKAAAWVWRALSLLAGSPGGSRRDASAGVPQGVPIEGLIEGQIEGQLLVVDYGCATTAELVERPMTDWLRGYRAHQNVALFAVPADVTCDVAFDQLAAHTRRLARMSLTTGADWLAAVGLDALTAEARRAWEATRAAPTAATLAARAQLDEAADLVDPNGFGAFLVAKWQVQQWQA